MPTVSNIPNAIRPYIWHGLDLSVRGDEAVGDCPWCGRAGKFYVSISEGLWQCKGCMEGSERGGGTVPPTGGGGRGTEEKTVDEAPTL